MAFGRGDGVRIANGPVVVMLSVNARVAVAPVLSVTCAVKLKTPVVAGTPLRMPVFGSSARPFGSDPSVIDHVYAGVPPWARNVTEYCAPSIAGGRMGIMVIVRPFVMTMVNGVTATEPA